MYRFPLMESSWKVVIKNPNVGMDFPDPQCKNQADDKPHNNKRVAWCICNKGNGMHGYKCTRSGFVRRVFIRVSPWPFCWISFLMHERGGGGSIS